LGSFRSTRACGTLWRLAAPHLALLDLAELAFGCQNVANITLGREALTRLPQEVLAENWEEMAAPHLATDDEWEYRRMAEFLELHAPSLLPGYLHLCAGHEDAEIR